jgi:hypothetical protein
MAHMPTATVRTSRRRQVANQAIITIAVSKMQSPKPTVLSTIAEITAQVIFESYHVNYPVLCWLARKGEEILLMVGWIPAS